jgi:hypothetical protein
LRPCPSSLRRHTHVAPAWTAAWSCQSSESSDGLRVRRKLICCGTCRGSDTARVTLNAANCPGASAEYGQERARGRQNRRALRGKNRLQLVAPGSARVRVAVAHDAQRRRASGRGAAPAASSSQRPAHEGRREDRGPGGVDSDGSAESWRLVAECRRRRGASCQSTAESSKSFRVVPSRFESFRVVPSRSESFRDVQWRL